MQDDLINLIELFDVVTQELIADVAVINYYNRQWNEDLKKKFVNIQDKGEILLQQVPEYSQYDEQLNKILNHLDILWREAKGKNLL